MRTHAFTAIALLTFMPVVVVMAQNVTKETVAGVNIPALVYGDLIGAARPMIGPIPAGLRWCKPWKDMSAARASGMSLAEWIPWMFRCEAKSGLAWDDPLPLIGATVRRGIDALARTVRRTDEQPLTLRSVKE